MGPILDAQLRVWDAKNFGLVSPGTHRNKFVKKSLHVAHLDDDLITDFQEPKSLDMPGCALANLSNHSLFHISGAAVMHLSTTTNFWVLCGSLTVLPATGLEVITGFQGCCKGKN